jgi:hypothetical protein
MDKSRSIGREEMRYEAKYGEAALATSLLTMMVCRSVKTFNRLFLVSRMYNSTNKLFVAVE